MATTTDDTWQGADGTPIACREKLKVLEENLSELHQVAQDAFEDALLMGVDEAAMRARLHALVDALAAPGRARR
jgi:L-aminopeptidase/D-esterase-like protein